MINTNKKPIIELFKQVSWCLNVIHTRVDSLGRTILVCGEDSRADGFYPPVIYTTDLVVSEYDEITEATIEKLYKMIEKSIHVVKRHYNTTIETYKEKDIALNRDIHTLNNDRSVLLENVQERCK